MKWFLFILLAVVAVVAIGFIKLVFSFRGVSSVISSNYKSDYDKNKK